MTNEVKIVPKLRFPGFESNWKEEKIKTLFKVVSGTTPLRSKKEYFDKAEVPWVKTTDLNNNVLRITDEKISNIAVKEVNMRILPENTLLIAMYGGFNQIGRTGIISFKSTINQAISALLDIEGKSDVNYLQAYFNYNVQKWKRLAASSRKDPNITKKDVENFKITIPNLKEQKRMGEFFSKLDRQIELEEQKLAKLEEQKKGYMQKIFSQELRFKDKNGDDYPEWMETNIRNTFDNKGGTALEKEFDNNGTHKVISIGSYSMNSTYNEQNIRINKNEFTEKYLLNEGDLAMVLNDKTKEGNIIGRSIYIDEDDKYIYNQRTERLIPVTGNNHKFLWYLMNSEQFRKKIKQMMQGATQVYINYNSIKDLSIYLPILEEQNKIENFLGDIFNIIKNQSDKVELLKRRKKGFLQKMFV